MLRVGITGEDTNFARYTHLTQVDLREHIAVEVVTCASEEALNKKVAHIQALQHNAMWEELETRAPWRLTLVRDEQRDCEDVIFAYHHALLDGVNGRRFHGYLLAALKLAASEQDPVLAFPEPPVLPESEQDAISFTLGPLYMAGVLWDEFGPAMLKPTPQTIWSGAPVSFSLPYITRIRPVDIPPAQSSILLTACRAHNTTITGLFHALAFAYFTKTIPAKDVPSFRAVTPMGMHNYLRADVNESLRHTFRVLTASMDHTFSATDVASMRSALTTGGDALDTVIWTSAARVREELAARSKTLTHNNVAGMMKHVSDWRQFHTSRDGTPRPNSWECSNVGLLTAEEGDDAISVTRVMFSNSATVTGAPVCGNLASAPNGHLTMALSWQQDVVTEDLVEGLGRALEEMIQRFCETNAWSL